MLNMLSLSSIKEIDSKPKAVFVVENQIVFSELLKMASVRVLDLLVKSGNIIHYSGDYDPEGIQIADRLIHRYANGRVLLWHMSAEEYATCKKGDAINISRLNKLKSISDSSLSVLSEAVMNCKKAAYQEYFISQMEQDITYFAK